MAITQKDVEERRARKAAAKYARTEPTAESAEPMEEKRVEVEPTVETASEPKEAESTAPIREVEASSDTGAGSAWEARQALRAREKERKPIKDVRRQIVLRSEDAIIIDAAAKAAKASGVYASFNDFATETLIEAAYRILDKAVKPTETPLDAAYRIINEHEVIQRHKA